jgi:hypothetical protein
MAADLEDHYGLDLVEDTRLTRSPHGRLEYLRTQDLIRRWLPRSGASVLDVGSGAVGQLRDEARGNLREVGGKRTQLTGLKQRAVRDAEADAAVS